MKGNIILSICIPTYNRGEWLKKNLEGLLPQFEKYHNEVEVIISDNNSVDNTKNIVEDLISSVNGQIQYVKQKENIGSQANFDFLVKNARGKYTMLMGDDDIFAPHFIDVVMSILKDNGELGLVHWNRLNGNEDCNYNSINDPIYNEKIVMTPEDFIKRTLSSTNFMSSIIFRTEYWRMGEDSLRDNWYGYRWIARLLNASLIEKRKCVYYYFPLVIQRNPSREWQKKWPYYLIVEMSQIFESLDNKVPGLLDKWLTKIYDDNYCDRVEITLGGIVDNVEYYRKKRADFYPYLRSHERNLFDSWLDAKDPIKARNNYYKKRKRMQYIRKLLRLIWRK